MGNRAVISALIVSGLVLSAGASVSVLTPTERMQKAIDALQAGELVRAEGAAVRLAKSGEEGAWRAWIVAATALQRQGKHFEARAAYRRYLRFCADPQQRAYVLEQIRHCERQARPAPAPAVPSERLTPDQRAKLSVVDEQVRVESSEHFVVQARNSDLAKLVAEQAEIALQRICRIILSGQEYPHSVRIHVWADMDEYADNARSAAEWSAGSFTLRRDDEGNVHRRIDLMQLDADNRFDLTMLDRILPHEMCHLVLAEFLGDAHCPLAVNEGLAMLAEAAIDNARVLLAGTALGGDKAIALSDLLTLRDPTPGNAKVFYAESFSLVAYLHARTEPAQFKEMLEHVKSGLPLDEALQRALYMPADERFLDRLAEAWTEEAIRQSQYLKAVERAPATTA